MKKYFLTVVYAIDDKPETVEAILSQHPWQAVAHTDALADLEHAQADPQAATDGYDAARLEIESLQARVQEHVRSGKDWAVRAEALERTITTLRAQITTLRAQITTLRKTDTAAQAAWVAGLDEGRAQRDHLRGATEMVTAARQPLDDKAIPQGRTDGYDAEDRPEGWAFTQGVRFAEHAHGITQEPQ